MMSWAYCKAFKYMCSLFVETGRNWREPNTLLNIVIDVGGGEKSIPKEESSSIAFLIPRDVSDGHNGWTLALAC